jgi:hypothetical protein
MDIKVIGKIAGDKEDVYNLSYRKTIKDVEERDVVIQDHTENITLSEIDSQIVELQEKKKLIEEYKVYQ